jgi:hypothetical protein
MLNVIIIRKTYSDVNSWNGTRLAMRARLRKRELLGSRKLDVGLVMREVGEPVESTNR